MKFIEGIAARKRCFPFIHHVQWNGYVIFLQWRHLRCFVLRMLVTIYLQNGWLQKSATYFWLGWNPSYSMYMNLVSVLRCLLVFRAIFCVLSRCKCNWIWIINVFCNNYCVFRRRLAELLVPNWQFKFCQSLQTALSLFLVHFTLCRLSFDLFFSIFFFGQLFFLLFFLTGSWFALQMSRLYLMRKILAKIYLKWVFRPHPLDFF